MSFFKKVFNRGADKNAPRHLEHPRDLNVNDMIKFKQYGPQLLQQEMFKVDEVNSYHYRSGKEFEFVLRSSSGADSRSGNTTNHTLFLTIDDSDDDPKMRMSVKVPRQIWQQLFEEAALALVIDQEQGHIVVKRRVDPDRVDSSHPLAFLAGWTAPEYIRESFAIRGYYYKGDYRNKAIPDNADDCEELDYYGLESNDEKFALEIEVYDGDTDVMVTYVTDVLLIEEMWPGN